MSGDRFDIVVLGPTGMTGRQLVRHLAARLHDEPVRWAVAGRSPKRIRAVLAEEGADVPVLHADISQPQTIEDLVDRCTVIANTAGPYARYADVVYETCARRGRDQVDVCAEIDWLHDRIVDTHDAAAASGARIVFAAGFESLPFDMATRLAAEAARRHHGEPLIDVDVAIHVDRDPPIVMPVDLISGGSFRSGSDALRRSYVRATQDARFLDVEPHTPVRYDIRARRHSSSGVWMAPMVPSPHINPAMLHRSAALCRDRAPGLFDRDCRFREGLASADLFPRVPGDLAASWVAAGQAVGSLLSLAPQPVRDSVADAVERFGPAPGVGPDEARLSGWSWRLDLHATTVGGHQVDVEVLGDGHPGYRSSANLLGEAAVLLAEGRALPEGGVLTPAVAFGTATIAAWERAGVSIRLAE